MISTHLGILRSSSICGDDNEDTSPIIPVSILLNNKKNVNTFFFDNLNKTKTLSSTRTCTLLLTPNSCEKYFLCVLNSIFLQMII